MKKILFPSSIALLILLIGASCGKTVEEQPFDPKWKVGDFDPAWKEAGDTYEVCDEAKIFQYYNFAKNTQYKGDRKAIKQYILANYKPIEDKSQNGYLTIRFVVNCEGEPGWYKVYEVDKDFQKTPFKTEISEQLIRLTKDLKDWIPAKGLLRMEGKDDGVIYDSYVYLSYKIKDGQVVEILP